MPRFAPPIVDHGYRANRYLHTPVTCGANEKQLWVRGPKFDVRYDWTLLDVWDERAGWLRLSATAFPDRFFRVDSLREAGVYEQVIDMAAAVASRCGGDRRPTSNSSRRDLSPTSNEDSGE